jgi:hypothetical protein
MEALSLDRHSNQHQHDAHPGLPFPLIAQKGRSGFGQNGVADNSVAAMKTSMSDRTDQDRVRVQLFVVLVKLVCQSPRAARSADGHGDRSQPDNSPACSAVCCSAACSPTACCSVRCAV